MTTTIGTRTPGVGTTTPAAAAPAPAAAATAPTAATRPAGPASTFTNAQATGGANIAPPAGQLAVPSLELGSPVKLGVVHFKGPTTYVGPTRLSATALTKLNGLKEENFGTTTVNVMGADGQPKPHTVRDAQYDLGNGKVGVRLVSVQDNNAAANAEMDKLVRTELGLTANDPIWALIAYIHPEEHTKSLSEAGSSLMTEMQSTHLGAYRGEGKTTNSPETYHSKTWNVGGYPANVQVMTLDGVPNGTLMRNMVNADSVLNQGVQFPNDYKNDPFLTTDLNTTLMFYRDWIKGEPYLNDNKWNTYCAEHKTIVANIGLNVPHNEAAFVEIYGAEGKELFAAFKAKFKAANGGKEFFETNFEPLWKKEGLTADQIRPFKDVGEWQKYQDSRFDGTLAAGTYAGFKPLAPGKGMAWTPETTADLVKNFVETYASFRDVGGYAAASAVLGFKDTVKDRMGITDEVYLQNAMPIINKMMIAEGMARAPGANVGEWAKQATAGLYLAFGGAPADLAPGGTVKAPLMGLAQAAMQGAGAAQAQITAASNGGSEAKRTEAAYSWLRGAIKSDLETARKVMVTNPQLTQMYSPPAVTNRVINGMVEKSKFVGLRVIATAVDKRDVN